MALQKAMDFQHFQQKPDYFDTYDAPVTGASDFQGSSAENFKTDLQKIPGMLKYKKIR